MEMENEETKFEPSLSSPQPYLQSFRLYETQLLKHKIVAEKVRYRMGQHSVGHVFRMDYQWGKGDYLNPEYDLIGKRWSFEFCQVGKAIGFPPGRKPLFKNPNCVFVITKFYMVGRDKSRTYWRVLTIDRSEPYVLNIREDSATYSESECLELLRRIHEGNKSTGGIKFVTTCYGIVGFIKFLGPYYMLLITKRRQIGAICGHIVYAISKSEMIPIVNDMDQSGMANYKDENRYKKILYMLDLTKDFFFSYSYHVMRSLQKNMCDKQSGQAVYETMCVWNEFLTRGIRNQLHNTLWTVALVYGFFKQSTLSAPGQEFSLTLIARRSRHYAGTRYLKRGVNEKGRVANDVETEQIVFEDVPEGSPVRVSSNVQNRGSIPLFWSQETSRLNLKPDIILSKKDQNYEATRLHFENLAKRYGNPIIILNLIKTKEKKPRESILRAEFANAIEVINRDLAEENRLKFLHLDLNKYSRSKATNVLLLLAKVATYALTLTGSFHCQLQPSSKPAVSSSCALSENFCPSDNSLKEDIQTVNEDTNGILCDASNNTANDNSSNKNPILQKGVLRTNCIDCLDRTNVAQYAYGLAALGQQLHVLGVIDFPKIDLGAPLADDLMVLYEKMGDTLAHQYGGSAAHNKIFSERRGQWRAATQSQEFFRTLQRYYSNAYVDAEKQNAINLFLGHFQPQQGKPAIWELGSDQDYKSGRNGNMEYDDRRTLFKRCWSDGNIIRKSSSPSATDVRRQKFSNKIHLDSSSDISASQSDVSYSRDSRSMTSNSGDMETEQSLENYIDSHDCMESSDCSNFLDLDWLSSSGHSCEEELIDRAALMSSSISGLSLENAVMGEATPSTSEYGSGMKGNEQTGTRLSYDGTSDSLLDDFSDSFVHWVTFGEALCH